MVWIDKKWRTRKRGKVEGKTTEENAKLNEKQEHKEISVTMKACEGLKKVSQRRTDGLRWAVCLVKCDKTRVLARQVARNKDFKVRIGVSEEGGRVFLFSQSEETFIKRCKR